MTQTLSRPLVRPPVPRSSGPPGPGLPALGALSATGAAVSALLPLTALAWALWLAEDRSGNDLTDVARSAGQLWLVAHGTWLELAGGRLGLTPLGLTLLPLLLCRRAGQRLAAARPDAGPLPIALAVAVPYAGLAVVAAVIATGDLLRPLPATAALGAAAVASVGAAWGGGRPLRARLSTRAGAALDGGTAASAALLAAAALLVAVALGMDAGTATELAESTEPGAVGGIGLVLLGGALAPNAVVFAAAWLAGPGFAVGTGTVVTPFATELGPVPGLALLAALPGGPPPGWAPVALLVPVLAGVVGGRLARRAAPPSSWWQACRSALVVGLVAGTVLGALAALAGGPLGGERLAAVGPSAWQVALAVAGEVALGAAVTLLLPARVRPEALSAD
jgi:hypothetical protein